MFAKFAVHHLTLIKLQTVHIGTHVKYAKLTLNVMTADNHMKKQNRKSENKEMQKQLSADGEPSDKDTE